LARISPARTPRWWTPPLPGWSKELPVEEIVRVFEKQQEQSVLHKVA
jgi:hypothetical protein